MKILGLFFLILAGVHGRHIWRWIQEGESHIVMSVGGDGIFGRGTKRVDEPFQFWFNVALNSIVIAGFALFGQWTLFGEPEL
jgi:hypothetical protein